METERSSSTGNRRRGRPPGKQKKKNISGVQLPRQRLARGLTFPVSRQITEETSSLLNRDEQRASTAHFIDVREPQKDIYRRVLELRETTIEDGLRRWQIIQAIFEDALLRLDPKRFGLSILYARLMPSREDGIHSLYELEMRGSYPDSNGRLQIMVDDLERSACAQPVMLAGRMAGVLVVSSTQPGFFMDQAICRSVVEYARLLTLALNDCDFYPCSQIHLKPMPDLKWQREEMSRLYVSRVVACASKENLSLPEAEEQVRQEMEEEFERSESRRLQEVRSASELHSTA